MKFRSKSGKDPVKYFDSNYTALTFALPLKKGVVDKGQKIFESWETTARKSLRFTSIGK